MLPNVMNKRSKSMEELMVKIVSKLKNDEITEDEAKTLLLRLFGVTNSFSKRKYKELVNDFLIQTEEEDKTKPEWQTKNNVPILHNSLNEFYGWLCKNYW